MSYVNTSSPVQIDSAYVDVLTSYSALHLVKNDGTLWAVNDSGAYGTGGLGNVIKTSSPVQLGAETNWSTNQNGVAVGDTAFYVKENGTLYGSGRGNVLASGANTDYSSPVQVATNVTAWAGHTQTANFIINGGLYATGVHYSQFGTSGIGSAVNYNLTQVGSATDWVYLIANERAAGGGRA